MIKYILNFNLHRFPPKLIYIANIANSLRAKRNLG